MYCTLHIARQYLGFPVKPQQKLFIVSSLEDGVAFVIKTEGLVIRHHLDDLLPHLDAECLWQRRPVYQGSGHSGSHTVAPEPGPLVRLLTAGERVQTQVTAQGDQLLEEGRVHQMLAAPHNRVLVLVLPQQHLWQPLEQFQKNTFLDLSLLGLCSVLGSTSYMLMVRSYCLVHDEIRHVPSECSVISILSEIIRYSMKFDKNDRIR